MEIRLPQDLERGLQAEVLNGHYPSTDAALADAVRMLLNQRRRGEVNAAEGATPALTAEQMEDQEAQRRLYAAGLLSEIRPPTRASTGAEHFSPVVIQGEPLSETVIRERR